ncbi:Xaa-Pro dipeptidase [Rhodovulum iodosum]|uniref:Xaa-Pro dipeptidase n=1 Tax=Rhodovulum iodosum TaxID=68291 RepID=A0ABV3XVQ5_9RHOB|nr:Xaa-Pro peptidase family protein [Rhodovulum robiginosum]RSK33428.1 aminopeptidase P family protein [Rhodovulum robiginosum]
MPRHFTDDEYAARVARAAAALRQAGLDALLIFAPESMYWLTGYDTFGFAMFQCMVLDADGRIDLLTRTPDLRQALFTSTLPRERIHIWQDAAGAAPERALAALLDRLGIAGRVGIETRTAGLTAHNGGMVAGAVEGLEEANEIIRDLRRVKSPAEIAHHRRAAALADAALDAALGCLGPGAFEGDILAAMQGAMLKGGGEPAANEIILGSGQAALMCRSFAGRWRLGEEDQVTIEWAGSHARYHAAMMRTVVIGPVPAAQRRMYDAARAALVACEAAMRPGAPMGDVYAAHAEVLDRAGYSHARLRACGYGMGAVFAPIWVDFPMFFAGNPQPMDAGQVFFLHMILMDSEAGLAMSLGHSVLLTETGPERLSRHAPDLIAL